MQRNKRTSSFLLPVIDLLIINLGLILAFFWRYPDKVFYEDVYYLNMLFFYNIAWLFCTYLFGAYKEFRISSVEKILRTLVQSILLHILLVAAFWVLIKGFYYSRQILLSSYGIIAAGLLIWRISHLYYQLYLRRLGLYTKKIVIAGKSEASMELGYFFTKNPQFGNQFLGYFDDENSEEDVLGKIDDLEKYATRIPIDEIYCLVPRVSDERISQLSIFAENNTIRLKIVPDIKSYSYAKSTVDFYGNTPVLNIKEFPLDKESSQLIKRIFDILFSLFVIVFVFSWLFPIVAILIKIDSKGPVFFAQKRSGKNNQIFKCFKFRSMKYSGNSSEFKQATKGDMRVTKIGKFIRKTSIDEMPQFFNVLLGNMSVVGPRPHPLQLDDEYKENVNKYMSRHFAKPGITGLSQIMGYRGETKDSFAMKARVNLDVFYIEHWSFFLDLKIILLTIYNVVKSEENAF